MTLGNLALIIVIILAATLAAEKTTPPATGPITQAINSIGSAFAWATIVLGVAALILVSALATR